MLHKWIGIAVVVFSILLSFIPLSSSASKIVHVSITPGASSKTFTAFDPNPIVIFEGTTVIWTNDDSTIHTVTSGTSPNPDGQFDSSPNLNPLMAPGDTFSHTFTVSATLPYFCQLHPNMVGEVAVVHGDPIFDRVIGGEILGIDMTTLVVVGATANAGWIIPVAGVTIAGIVGYLITRRLW